MSRLEQRVSVACPIAQADMRLKGFLRDNAADDPDAAKLTVGIDMNVPGLPVPLSLRRSVVATVVLHRRLGDMTPRYRVEWSPETPGPFPNFSGELLIESGDDYDSMELRLSGDYTPPLGLVGKGFDIAVGNRVAQATANDLLQRIKDKIERAFLLDEAAKRKPKPRIEP